MRLFDLTRVHEKRHQQCSCVVVGSYNLMVPLLSILTKLTKQGSESSDIQVGLCSVKYVQLCGVASSSSKRVTIQPYTRGHLSSAPPQPGVQIECLSYVSESLSFDMR